jgi:hypothetical protein
MGGSRRHARAQICLANKVGKIFRAYKLLDLSILAFTAIEHNEKKIEAPKRNKKSLAVSSCSSIVFAGLRGLSTRVLAMLPGK